MKLYPILFSEASLQHPELSGKTATIDEVQGHFAHFHLSSKFLGEPTFTFNPKIPRYPFEDIDGNVIEDDFTKRISLAADIEDARDAVIEQGGTCFYVYGIQEDTNIESVIDNRPDCPTIPPNEYNTKFRIKKWLRNNHPDVLNSFNLKDQIKPSSLPKELKDKFQGCVPDSNKTYEEWSRQPLQMIFIGTIGEGNQEVQLSNEATRIIGL